MQATLLGHFSVRSETKMRGAIFAVAIFFCFIFLEASLALRKFLSSHDFVVYQENGPNRTSLGYGSKKQLIWSDEFDFFDRRKWTPMITGWRGDSSFQYYTDRPENLYVQEGALRLRPTLTADRFGEEFLYNGTLDLWKEGCNANWGGGCVVHAGEDIIQPIQSARIHTKDSFSLTYGIIESRIKMPKGDWIWPAFWMAPTFSVYGSNPRSGEIDITEVRCNRNLTCGKRSYGRQMSSSTLHWGPDHQHDGHRSTHWEKIFNTSDFSSDYHTFAVEWSTQGFRFFIDHELIGSVFPPPGGFWKLGKFCGDNIWKNGTVMAPFDQSFHLIIDIAVGGNMFPDWCINDPHDNKEPVPKPWNMNDSDQMKRFWQRRSDWYPTWNVEDNHNVMSIDYIRVYSLD